MDEKEWFTVAEAAQHLGISRVTLWLKLKRLGIEYRRDANDLRRKLISKKEVERLCRIRKDEERVCL